MRRICRLIVALLVYVFVAAYAPFARCPELSDELAARVEARAEEMGRDIDTADRGIILETWAEALDERIRLLSRAQSEIVITTFNCHDGESIRDMLCVALERADAGVRVRMLVDGVDGWLKLSAAPVFRAMEAHPNVEIRFYNPPTLLTPWKVMGRMHDKYVIVDDVAYILGGRNMLDNFLGDYPVEVPKDDREALIYNAACGTPKGEASSLYQLKDYFEAIWSSDAVAGFLGEDLVEPHREDVYADLRQRLEALKAQRPELFADALDYGQRTVPTKGIWLISNPTNVSAKQPVAFAQLCALMDRAEQSVVIHSPYAVLNGYMRDRLAKVAERVPMTLMVNAPENSANIAGTGDYVYHRDDVLSTGAALLEYAGGNYHHGKALAIDDDISIIGCFNLDLRSAYVDTELMLVVRGEEINAWLRRNMDALHADCRRVIDADTSEVPEGLEIPPMSTGRKIALRVVGALMQLFRNIV